jgi:uncharacterized membrane protein YcaP (DUF421 family)
MASAEATGGMFHDMFDFSHMAEVSLRTLVVYIGLLLAMRVAGKREVGQMKPFDLVTLLIISNAVQNAMVGQDSSLVGGLVAAGVILACNYIVGKVRSRFALAQKIFEGSPTLIVHDGQLVMEHLHRENLCAEDVLQAMREHGVDDLTQVKTAILEVDGSISIIQNDNITVTKTRKHFRRFSHP